MVHHTELVKIKLMADSLPHSYNGYLVRSYLEYSNFMSAVDDQETSHTTTSSGRPFPISVSNHRQFTNWLTSNGIPLIQSSYTCLEIRMEYKKCTLGEVSKFFLHEKLL